MTLPSSRIKALRLALADYLSTKTAAIDSTASEWLYYSEAYSPSDPPKGTIFMGITQGGLQTNLELIQKTHKVSLRWRVGNSSALNAIALAEDWAEALFLGNASVMRELFVKGHSGAFGGIAFTDTFKGITIASPVSLAVERNEDGGAIVTVAVQYEFVDKGNPNEAWVRF